MRLIPPLRVDRAKIVDYLLNRDHADGAGKAEFFFHFGFRVERWEELADALREIPLNHEAVRMVESPYGIRNIVDGTLTTPDGRNPRVRTVWIRDKLDDGTEAEYVRLVTAYPA